MSRIDNLNLVRYTQNLKTYIGNSIQESTVQADWNQNDASAKDYLKNKPNVLINSNIDSEFFDLLY